MNIKNMIRYFDIGNINIQKIINILTILNMEIVKNSFYYYKILMLSIKIK